MEFKRVFTGSPWEPKIGYCRAIKAGNQIYVTGTAPVGDDGQVVAPGDPYRQTKRCFEIIEKALKGLNADLSQVVRTRLYVSDISKWQDYGRAHGELFAKNPPATTMVEVKSLIDPKMMVEVEADVVVG
jgi:isochorismate pyruvate lyase